jgi:hypothetical protein
MTQNVIGEEKVCVRVGPANRARIKLLKLGYTDTEIYRNSVTEYAKVARRKGMA